MWMRQVECQVLHAFNVTLVRQYAFIRLLPEADGMCCGALTWPEIT